MRNTVAVDMTTGGTITAYDAVAENENSINLLVHTGAGANPKMEIQTRDVDRVITGFAANSIYFYKIPSELYPTWSAELDDYMYVTLSDDSQTAQPIRFRFTYGDTTAQMTLKADVNNRLFITMYAEILTDAEIAESITNANQAIEQLPQTITNTASSATVANNVNAFNLDSVFESLITNIKPVLLKYVATDDYQYVNTPPSNQIRNYLTIKENYLQFVEAHLPSGNSFTAADTTLFTLGGAQVYYTSITGSNAYKYLTFTSPTVLNGQSADVEAYKVRVPTPTATYIKGQYKWTYDSTMQSYVVDIILGAGDQNGRGIAKIRKDNNGLDIRYLSRTTNTDFGIKVQDDGFYGIFGGAVRRVALPIPYNSVQDAQADVGTIPALTAAALVLT